jgi:hypothetical protein
MNKLDSSFRRVIWLSAFLFATLSAGCGGGGDQGRDPILGTGGIAVPAPMVTAVAPVNNTTGVPFNTTIITAAFSKDMAPATINTSTFTLACPVGAPITGTVAYIAASRAASFTTASNLPAGTICTGTITTGATDTLGIPLGANFVWTFTTGSTADTTRPRVILTTPATTAGTATLGVATNTAIFAAFSEDMSPATINAASFTLTCPLPCVSPAGTVSYALATRTALFTPAAVLAGGTTYTATVTSAATDLAGIALGGNQAPLPAASNYLWTFTTAGPTAPANISVISTNPVSAAGNVCPSASINASFGVPSGSRLDPTTVNSGTFTVTGPAPALTPVVASSVLLDLFTGRVATFAPLNPLSAGLTYTAKIKGGSSGVKDMLIPANILANDFTWTFTVAAAVGSCLPPVDLLTVALGSAASFGTFGGSAGVTNQGVLTVINGDIGTTAASTLVTGFHDAGPGCIYTETPLNVGTVNGKIYTAAPPPTVACPSEGTQTTFNIATQARADGLAAYNALVARPRGSDPGAGNLGSLVLAPGVYTAGSGSFRIQGGNLTLDAQGNASAVWVFQMATTLTVGGPGAAFPQSIILTNGAQAKNVFWQVGSAATINAGGGGTMVGTIISQDGVTFSTAGNATISTLNGRALSLGASVTVVNTVINVPAP